MIGARLSPTPNPDLSLTMDRLYGLGRLSWMAKLGYINLLDWLERLR